VHCVVFSLGSFPVLYCIQYVTGKAGYIDLVKNDEGTRLVTEDKYDFSSQQLIT